MPNYSSPSPLQLKTFLAAISGVFILWLPVLTLHLTLVLFSALITYSATRAIANLIRRYAPDFRFGEPIALLLLITILGVGGYAFGDWVGERAGAHNVTSLMQQMAVILDQLHNTLPASLSQHIPASVIETRELLTKTLRNHAAQLQLAGAHTLRGFGYALAGIVIGGLAVTHIPARPAATAKPLAKILRSHFDELVHGFTDVFFAQVRISTLNTLLTSVYLIGILPLMGKPLPMSGTLIAITFFAGLLPVVGNLISNTIIVILSLSDSLAVAGMSLGWLVIIHKLEYFLNAQIIGNKIRSSAWELLIAMLVFESIFGIAGLISAPVIYAQIKRILTHKGWV